MTKKLRSSGEAGGLMVTDAVEQLKATGFDFSTLSVDAGNYVIATSLLWAGGDSGEWAKGLWPHRSNTTRIEVGTPASPRFISSYQATNVANAAPVIGTICHELGHLVMGFPDLYDSDKTNGKSAGIGNHGLMGGGNQLNGERTPAPINLYLKDVVGWANITELAAGDSLGTVLASSGRAGYRIAKPGVPTEYFLFENRGNAPEDRWAAHCPARGIMIWHVDENPTNAGGYANGDQQRTAEHHYQVSLEQADGRFDLESKSGDFSNEVGDSGDLYAIGAGNYDQDWWDKLWGLEGSDFVRSNTTFNHLTNPNSNWWDGTKSGVSLEVLDGAKASMRVQFGPRSVTNLADSGDGSLRWALASPAGGTITFDPALSGRIIPILSELRIDRDVTIDASGLKKGITISGATLPVNRRLINITQPKTVTLKGLTFTFGNAERGGAIYTIAKTLEVNGCTFHGNFATNYGSALFQYNTQPGGLCRIINSTFTNNTVGQKQGCIYNQAGEMILSHCTVAYNSNGGDIIGAGVVNERGNLKFYNSIIAKNIFGISFPYDSDVVGDYTTLGPNIIRVSMDGNVLSGGATLTQDPQLDPLADNGGPTWTMMPRPGSPAFGVVANTTYISRDQRGFPRPARSGGSPVLGAVEATAGPQLYSYQQQVGVLSSTGGARDFGHRLPGTSRTLEFCIANAGNTVLSGIGLSFTGPDAAQFTVDTPPATQVQPRSSTAFTVVFSPASAGVKSATLNIASNDPDANPFVIPLTGIGDSTFTDTRSTAGAPVWNRPEAGEPPTALSATATATRYDVVSFGVTTEGEYTFTSAVTPFGQWEDFLFLYAGAFDPGSPLENAQRGALGPQAAGFTQFLTPSVRYYAVTTGRTNSDAGAYQLTITGPSPALVFAPAVVTFPTSNQSGVNIYPAFSWTAVAGAEYELFLGTSPGNLVSQGFQTSPFTISPPLSYNTTYYWRLDTYQAGSVVTGNLHSFTTRATILVTTELDENDAALGLGSGDSLREAIASAPVGPASIIEFDPSLSGRTILLNGSQLAITKNLTIDASTLPDGITIKGSGGSRVFAVSSAVTVGLRKLTVTGGNSSLGGGINNTGATLSLDRCTVTGNQSPDSGGGAYNAGGGSLTVIDSTFALNTAADGGGIYNLGTPFTVKGSTFSGNGSSARGGGIYNAAANALVENCTLNGNSSVAGTGGGLSNNGNASLILRHCTIAENIGAGTVNTPPATITLDNTLVGNNFNTLNSLFDVQGNFTAVGANLVRVFTGSVSGPAPIQADPILEPLTANDGSTRTMHPRAGSPFIDAGVATANTPAGDQENSFRPRGAAPDIGSIESSLNTNTNLDWLTTSAGTINPAFQPAITAYTVTVPAGVTSAAVKAAAGRFSQTLQVRINSGAFSDLSSKSASAAMPLSQGANPIEIEVTAESGAKKSYILTVIRGAPSANNTGLSALTTAAGALRPAFNDGVTSYSTFVPNTTATTTVTAVAASAGATLAVRANFGPFSTITSGAASPPLPLNIGANAVDVRVTAADGTSTGVYSITITRDDPAPANASLAALAASAGSLSPAFSHGQTFYRIDVPDQITHSTVTATPAQSGATIAVRTNGGAFTPLTSGVPSTAISLSAGTNLIEVQVTAQDAITVKSYTLIVTRRVDHTEWASKRRLAPTGQANDTSRGPSISSDGRYVAFSSRATDLVAGDTNNSEDVFVYDRTLQVVERVSISNAGQEGTYNGGSNGESKNPSISADGRYVAFQSRADNLVPDDTNGQNDSSQGEDIFVYDRTTHTIERVSLRSNGTESTRPRAETPSISGDGRYVAFVSGDNSSNMVDGFNTDGSNTNVYVRDRIGHTTAGVSVPFGSLAANRDSLNPVFSTDGNYVAFEFAVDTSEFPQYQYRDIYLYNRATRGVERITGSKAGEAANRTESRSPSLSADGRYVAFQSNLEDLDFYDNNSAVDVFVYDRVERRTRLVSVDSSGTNEGIGESTNPSISGDGRYVTFESRASNFVSGDTNGSSDVFMKDMLTGAISRVSVNSAGDQGDGDSSSAAVSFDGRSVAFESFAANFGPDTNDSSDVFIAVTDALAPTTLADLASLTSNCGVFSPGFSPGVISYSANVANEVDTAYLQPVAADSAATTLVRIDPGDFSEIAFSGIAALPLNIGLNTLAVKVTAMDGIATKTYTIAVTRAPSSNALLADLAVNGGILYAEGPPLAIPLEPAFASAMTAYSANVSNEVTSINILPAAADSTATVKVNAVPLETGAGSAPVSLNVGSNVITVVVTAQDGTTTKTYTLTINRAASSDASLANLVPGTGVLTPEFGNETSYSISVAGTTASMTVTATVAQAGATVKVNQQPVVSGAASGAITLFTGTNTISVEVTAPDGATTRLYILTVMRPETQTTYAVWASANIPAGSDASFAGDWNGDGIPNGVAYVFGTTRFTTDTRGTFAAPPAIPADVDVYLDRSTDLANGGWTPVVSWIAAGAPVFADGVSIVSGEVRDTFAGPQAFYRYRAVQR